MKGEIILSEYYSPHKIITIFGLAKSTVYEAVARGDLPSIQKGSRRVVWGFDAASFYLRTKRGGLSIIDKLNEIRELVKKEKEVINNRLNQRIYDEVCANRDSFSCSQRKGGSRKRSEK